MTRQGNLEIRPMHEPDFAAVLDVTNLAFIDRDETMYGKKRTDPFFADLMAPYRLAADPEGCHVALLDGKVVGANFSILRGTIGFFGPLAVRPDAQGGGVAQALVREFIRSAEERGGRLLGLETFANSPLHIHLYQKLGFRPSWVGITYRREVWQADLPADVEIDGAVPDLGYIYPGLDAASDARATRAMGAGITITCGDGFAVCHLKNTLWADPKLAYVPLIIARDRKTFDTLLQAVDAVAGSAGKTWVTTQVPGSAWPTQEALLQHGFRPGGASLRMKRGEQTDYDGGVFFYCDDWH